MNAVAFSPDGQWVVTGAEDGGRRGGMVCVLAAATGKARFAPFSPVESPGASVEIVSFSADGAEILTGTLNYGGGTNRWGEARVWDAVTGRPLSPALRLPNVLYFAALDPGSCALDIRHSPIRFAAWPIQKARA